MSDVAAVRRLGDVLQVQSGFAFKTEDFSAEEGVPLIRIRDIDSSSTEAFYRGEYRPEFLVNSGDYLIGMDGNFRCHRWKGPQGLLNQRVARLHKFSAAVVPEYVYYGIQRALSEIENTTAFATVKHLSAKQIAGIGVVMPAVKEQERIADILSRAESIIRLRKQALEKIQALIPALFVDMFGDPASNPKGWLFAKVQDIAEVQGGLQVTKKRAEYPIARPYLRVANVYRNRMNLSEIKEIRVTEQEAERVAMMRGDILVVEGHGNPEEVGRCAVWRGEIEGCLHQNHLIRVRANNARVLPEFLSFYLNSPSGRASLIRSGKTTSGLSTISTSNVKGVPLFIPPLELQDRFSSLVEDIGSVRQQAERQLEVAEATFQSLLHRAFSGELSA